MRAVHGAQPVRVYPFPAAVERARGRGRRRFPHLRARTRCRTGAPCAPETAATMAQARHPKYPDGMGSALRKVAVLVLIGDDGTVLGATVAESSSNALGDGYALQSARIDVSQRRQAL